MSSSSGGPRRSGNATTRPEFVYVHQAYQQLFANQPRFAPHAEFVFKELNTLGRGGMGVVVKVKDRRMSREAARKTLLPGASPERQQRFIREAEIMARLNHPAIPAIYEFGFDINGRYYLLMPVISGETLKAHLEDLTTRNRLPHHRRQLLEVLLSVSEGLAYSHAQGVLHRDLKPANIMLGHFGEVFIMDWGLACFTEKLRAKTDHCDDLTRSRHGVGSPGYMSPEQARGESIREQSDVFALGILLYEILTGLPAIGGETRSERIHFTATIPITDENLKWPDSPDPVPAALRSLTLEALKFDSRERTTSVIDFAAELRAYLADQPLICHPESTIEKAQRLSRKNPLLLSVCGTVMICLVFVSVIVHELKQSRELKANARREASALKKLAAAQEERLKAESEAKEAILKVTKRTEQERLNAESNARKAQQTLEKLASIREELKRGVRGAVVATRIIQLSESVPPAPEIYELTAQLLIQSGSYLEAEKTLKRWVAKFPPAYSALILWHELILRQRATKRESVYWTRPLKMLINEAQKRGETNQFTYFVAGVRKLDQRKFELAIQDFSAALEEAPTFSGALDHRGTCYSELGQFDKALRDFERAHKVDPESVWIRYHLAAVRWKLGQLSSALNEIKTVCLETQGFGRARDLQAIILAEMKRYWEAIEVCNASLKQAPYAFEPRLNRAICYRQVQRYKESRADLNWLIERAPNRPEAYSQSALTALMQRSYEEATQLAYRAQKLGSNAATDDYVLGEAFLRLKDYEKALAAFNRAIAKQPQNYLFYGSRSQTFASLYRFKEALQDGEKSLQLNPESLGAKYYIGQAHFRLGRMKSGLKYIDEAINGGYFSGSAFLVRAQINEALGNFEKALADCRRAMSLLPENANYYCQRGLIYARMGRFEAMSRDFVTATKLEPDNGRLRYNYCCALGVQAKSMTKNKDKIVNKALAELERALKLGYSKFALIRRDSDLTEVRKDSRFEAIVAQFEH